MIVFWLLVIGACVAVGFLIAGLAGDKLHDVAKKTVEVYTKEETKEEQKGTENEQ